MWIHFVPMQLFYLLIAAAHCDEEFAQINFCVQIFLSGIFGGGVVIHPYRALPENYGARSQLVRSGQGVTPPLQTSPPSKELKEKHRLPARRAQAPARGAARGKGGVNQTPRGLVNPPFSSAFQLRPDHGARYQPPKVETSSVVQPKLNPARVFLPGRACATMRHDASHFF